MSATLVLTEDVWEQLRTALADCHEKAGVLSARAVEGSGDLTLLGRQLTWAAHEAYVTRAHDGLALRSTGWLPAARAAIADDCTAIFVHTHPGGKPVFSDHDDHVDDSMLDAFQRFDADGRYASLVIAGSPDNPQPTARIYDNQREQTPVSKFRIIGERIQVILTGAAAISSYEPFDRQIRVFGSIGQQVIASLHVAVVGAGGTGSAVAEQLTRLGVGMLTLVDDDVVTEATATRGYGITMADIGRPKADVLAEHLRRIGLGTQVNGFMSAVQDPLGRDALRHADVVFCCADGHGARLVLNRWAYAHLAPVLDVAVLVTAEDGHVTGIDGRVTWLSPGAACLLCRNRIDPALAYAEMLHPDERKRLAGEGYVQKAETTQPSVVTLTSLIASLATTELLQRMFNLADPAPTELLARIHERDLRRNRAPQRAGCFCRDKAFLGRGLESPYLDLLWPA
jgi:molybdopterin/thiamine biosynthesis adenylyltransferase